MRGLKRVVKLEVEIAVDQACTVDEVTDWLEMACLDWCEFDAVRVTVVKEYQGLVAHDEEVQA